MQSPFTHFIHALLLQLHPTAPSQLLDKIVQNCAPTGNMETCFSSCPASLDFWHFWHFFACMSVSRDVVFCAYFQALFPSVSKLSLPFPVSLQWLLRAVLAWSPKPSLLPAPKFGFSSHSEPLFQLSSPCDCPDHHTPLGTPFPSWTSPKSCFSFQQGVKKTQPKPHRTCQKSIQTPRARK